MAIYGDGTQSIMNAALGEYRSKGFCLVKNKGDIATLFYRDDMVAAFNYRELTYAELRAVCQEYIEKMEVK